MRSFKKNSDYQTKRLTLRFECILEFLCNFWSLVPLSLILIHAARRHFGTPLTLQKTLSKERVLPKDTKYVIGMKTQKFTPTCFKTFYFSLFFFFPPLTPHLPISSLLPLHSVSLSFLTAASISWNPPTHTAAPTNRRGLNQAATVAGSAATQAFGAMGQQVQKAAAQAAAQAAVNEVQNQFSNMMRTGLKK